MKEHLNQEKKVITETVKEDKDSKKSSLKTISSIVGFLSLGFIAGYVLGKRSEDNEFYEVSYEDL